jgi:hypothetical protein
VNALVDDRLQIPDVNTALDLLINGDFKSGPKYLDASETLRCRDSDVSLTPYCAVSRIL